MPPDHVLSDGFFNKPLADVQNCRLVSPGSVERAREVVERLAIASYVGAEAAIPQREHVLEAVADMHKCVTGGSHG
jgi:hypothetical protein